MSTTINKNLGHVTAYAYAKAGGYTGTEAEFQALLGNIAIDLSEIENLTVVVNTLPAGSSATSSYSDGVLTLGIPRGDTGEVSEADLVEALEDYVEKTTLDDYARVDGYYQEMTVGDAEQLVATTFTEDDTPYNFRTAGGAIDIGDRKQVEGIVGGTVAWNQLVYNGNFASLDGWNVNGQHSKSVSNNAITVTMNADATVSTYINNLLSKRSVPNHVYMYDFSANPSRQTKMWMSYSAKFSNTKGHVCSANQWTDCAGVIKSMADNTEFLLCISDPATILQGDTVSLKNYNIFDLTQIFGSTIADYIYSLEQATAGAGVAWFKKYFPKSYYAYNAGELMSVKALRHITRGFNAWDEEWELGTYNTSTGEKQTYNSMIRCKNFIPVIPNVLYFTFFPYSTPMAGYALLFFYDADKSFISYTSVNANGQLGLITTPSNAHYMTFFVSTLYGTTYKNDICINLSWDGERDGEYEEYVEHVYELDPDLELRGIPKLSAGNDPYFDGDVYEPDGTVTRKYGVVDLGTLDWVYGSGYNGYFYSSGIASLVADKQKCVSSIYTYAGLNSTGIENNNMAVCINTNENGGALTGVAPYKGIVITNRNYTDATTFKTAMNGVYLVYELATPTTESADPYNGTQIVDDFGTEEFVDAGVEAETRDVSIPVGHNSLYQPNLRAKLEMVPEAPEDNGYYVVYHHDGINEYVPLIIPQELPELPSEDGTYTLKCTVASGSATLSFESEV